MNPIVEAFQLTRIARVRILELKDVYFTYLFACDDQDDHVDERVLRAINHAAHLSKLLPTVLARWGLIRINNYKGTLQVHVEAGASALPSTFWQVLIAVWLDCAEFLFELHQPGLEVPEKMEPTEFYDLLVQRALTFDDTKEQGTWAK